MTPPGTCQGKATIVDISEDPITYHLSEAIRYLREKAGSTAIDAREQTQNALETWNPDAVVPE